MPRPSKPGDPERKRRSRTGCWPCKARKVKCGEEKPTCRNCQRQGETCDYSIRLNWEGRGKRKLLSTPSSNPFVKTVEGFQRQVGTAFAPSYSQMSHSSTSSAYPPQAISSTSNIAAAAAAVPGQAATTVEFLSDSAVPVCAPQTIQPKSLYGIGQLAQPGLPSSLPSVHIPDYDPGQTQLPGYDMNCASLVRPGRKNAQQLSRTDSSGTLNDETRRLLPTESQRVSVQSLLTPSVEPLKPDFGRSPDWQTASPLLPGPKSPDLVVISYGYDSGRPDLDIAKNDDFAAIDRELPPDHPYPSPQSNQDSSQARAIAAFDKGGYYARPVPINIPRDLTPLPATLQDSPINLLYFHHFINHTARILVPHDCSKNPFATVLPAMAINCENVLSMLLAYSASHRARLLGHAEPYGRIALWTRHVFTNLRESLDHPRAKISDTALAASIMLVSLKIISPTTFEVPIPWQSHLKFAREVFISRRDAQGISASNTVDFFLCRWLSYLDIIGSLSSPDAEPPLLGGNYWTAGEGGLDESEVDCFAGFTPRCQRALARVAQLIHECDLQKLTLSAATHAESLLSRAERLLCDLQSMGSPEASCRRRHHTNDSGLLAIDEAYRLTAIVHLYRRVLGRSALDVEVREAVAALFDALGGIPYGGLAEACTLLPLFTAGCETTDPARREEIRRRVKSFEGLGMKQVRRARKLMQRSWQENLPWTELADGEFLG